MQKLLDIKSEIEKNTGIILSVVSGGTSATLPLIEDKNLPKG